MCIGVESTRCTYWGARAPPRFTFTTNLMFFIFLSLAKTFTRMRVERSIYFSTITSSHYYFETLATPHSRHRGLSRDVINPQDGHILCDRNLVLCAFTLRLRRSSRIANSTISSPKEILVAFIKRPFLASSAMTKHPVSRSTG